MITCDVGSSGLVGFFDVSLRTDAIPGVRNGCCHSGGSPGTGPLGGSLFPIWAYCRSKEPDANNTGSKAAPRKGPLNHSLRSEQKEEAV